MKKIIILTLFCLSILSCKRTYKYTYVQFDVESELGKGWKVKSQPIKYIEAENDLDAYDHALLYFECSKEFYEEDDNEYSSKTAIEFMLFDVEGRNITDSIKAVYESEQNK